LIRKLLVTGLGTGYLPIAPGSWGSAAVGGLFVLIAWATGYCTPCVIASMAGIALLASIICVALGSFAERAFGRKDPPQVTIDEWAGQAVAYLVLPLRGGMTGTLAAAVAGFLAFRILDILKPPPARQLERLPHGWGVLADDLAAGVYANIVCQAVLRLVPISGT